MVQRQAFHDRHLRWFAKCGRWFRLYVCVPRLWGRDG
jgi:hypothetical protein